MNEIGSANTLQIPSPPDSCITAARARPIVLLLVAFAIFDLSIAAVRPSIETAQFFVLAFVYPQLSLGVAWLTLSRWRLLYRIAMLAGLAIVYLRIAPAGWWAWELTYKMSQFEWFYLPWTQLAIVGGLLGVARRQGLQIAAGSDGRWEPRGDRMPRSMFSDACWVCALIAAPMLLSDGFSIGGAWIYVNERTALRMSALGGVFGIEALLAFGAILGVRRRWYAIAACPVIAWALGKGLESLFFSRSPSAQIPLAAVAHMLTLLMACGVARGCGYRIVARESICGHVAGMFTLERLADLTRWLFAGSVVAGLIVAGYATERWSLALIEYSTAPRALLFFTAITLLAIWAWLASAPLILRAFVLGIGVYWCAERQDEREEIFVLCLALALPLLYLRRGRLRLATRRRELPTAEFDHLPKIGLRDYFLMTAVIALAMLRVKSDAPAVIFAMAIFSITFATITLAAIRVVFSSNRSKFWVGVRLVAPMCAAIGFACGGRIYDVHGFERLWFYAITLYAYTLLLNVMLGLLRRTGIRLVTQTPLDGDRQAAPPNSLAMNVGEGKPVGATAAMTTLKAD